MALGGLAGSGNINLNDTLTSPAAVALTIGNSNTSYASNTLNPIYSGILSNTITGARLTKVGTNTQTLSGANSYTGTTTIQAGSLVVGANSAVSTNGALGNAASAIVLGNASTGVNDAPSLLINGAFTVDRAIALGSLVNTAAYNATVGGSNGSGTSIYTGAITLNTTASNYTTTLQAATGGTVDFQGAWTTNNKAIAIGSSGHTGTVKLTSAISTSAGISVNYGSLNLGAAFTGNLVAASGTTLSGTGSVSGTTGVTGGTVNGTGLVLTGVTTFTGSGNTLSGTVTSTNGVTMASGAALAQSGTLTGAISIGNGTLSGTGSVSGAASLNGGTVNKASGSLGSLAVTGGNWIGDGSVIGAITSTSGTFTIASGATLTATSGVSATGGALVVNGTLSGTLIANSSTTVSGTGTVSGNATISGIHNPGNSPGIQTFDSNLAYTGGAAVVNWELDGNTVGVLANPNANFDQIVVGGNLDFTNITAINMAFNGGGSTVLWGNAFWDSAQSWTLYDVAGTTSNFANLSLNNFNWLDSGGGQFNTLRAGNSFTLTQIGNDVILNYAVVPEPNVAALLGGLGTLLLLRRRR